MDNLPRVLPKNCDAVIQTDSWKVPELFRVIQQGGKVDFQEMYQVFNMGIGMTIVVAEKDAAQTIKLTKAKRIGWIEAGEGRVQLA